MIPRENRSNADPMRPISSAAMDQGDGLSRAVVALGGGATAGDGKICAAKDTCRYHNSTHPAPEVVLVNMTVLL